MCCNRTLKDQFFLKKKERKEKVSKCHMRGGELGGDCYLKESKHIIWRKTSLHSF